MIKNMLLKHKIRKAGRDANWTREEMMHSMNNLNYKFTYRLKCLFKGHFFGDWLRFHPDYSRCKRCYMFIPYANN